MGREEAKSSLGAETYAVERDSNNCGFGSSMASWGLWKACWPPVGRQYGTVPQALNLESEGQNPLPTS